MVYDFSLAKVYSFWTPPFCNRHLRSFHVGNFLLNLEYIYNLKTNLLIDNCLDLAIIYLF